MGKISAKFNGSCTKQKASHAWLLLYCSNKESSSNYSSKQCAWHIFNFKILLAGRKKYYRGLIPKLWIWDILPSDWFSIVAGYILYNYSPKWTWIVQGYNKTVILFTLVAHIYLIYTWVRRITVSYFSFERFGVCLCLTITMDEAWIWSLVYLGVQKHEHCFDV